MDIDCAKILIMLIDREIENVINPRKEIRLIRPLKNQRSFLLSSLRNESDRKKWSQIKLGPTSNFFSKIVKHNWIYYKLHVLWDLA